MEQRSNEWLAWRRKGIGGSEIAAILGESEFATAKDIWELKTGRREEPIMNFAMRRGSQAEPRIRALYELEVGADFEPHCVENEKYPFIRASLDGYNKELNKIAEFKYPSKKKHELAKSGVLPPMYYSQVQQQLFVSGAASCDYVSYDGRSIVIVPILPDLKKIQQIVEACIWFWNECVLKDVAPV